MISGGFVLLFGRLQKASEALHWGFEPGFEKVPGSFRRHVR